MHKSSKSRVIETENSPVATIQSNKVWRNNAFISNIWRSLRSKQRSFCSLQRHQSRQWGTASPITKFWVLPKPAYQHSSRFITPRGITHWTPNRLIIIQHSSWATGQWGSKWSIKSLPNCTYNTNPPQELSTFADCRW